MSSTHARRLTSGRSAIGVGSITGRPGVGPSVIDVELAGSRSRGTHNELSDWAFVIRTSDFDSVSRDLPRLVEPLEPLGAQWEALGPASSSTPRMLEATSFRRDCFPTGAVAPLGSSSWMASARSRGDTPHRRRLTAVALSGNLDRSVGSEDRLRRCQPPQMPTMRARAQAGDVPYRSTRVVASSITGVEFDDAAGARHSSVRAPFRGRRGRGKKRSGC